MTYILIILGVSLVLFFVFKNKIKKIIQEKARKKNEDQEEYVFIPVELTRQFSVNFIIEEVGGGKAKIIIQK